MSGALDPVIQQEIIDRDLYATAVLSGNRNFDGRIHPYAKQAFLASPPLVVAYAIAGTIRFDIEKDALGHRRRRQADHCSRTCGRATPRSTPSSRRSVKPEQFRKVYEPMFKVRGANTARRSSPLYDWRAAEHLHPPPAVLGRRAGRRAHADAACARWRCWATTSPPIICRRRTRSWPTARPASTWRRWACRRRTSIPTPPIAAIT